MGLSMSDQLNIAVPLTMSLGECPLWDHRHHRLHWIDIHAGRIYSWTPSDNTVPHVTEVGEPVGSLALSAEGLLAATASGLWLLDNDGDKRQLAANPEWLDGVGNRFNDGRCDAQGRFWVGTLDRNETAPSAALYCWNGESLACHLRGLAISNGLAFSPDGAWMYHADSPRRQVWRYPYDLQNGQPGRASHGSISMPLASRAFPTVPRWTVRGAIGVRSTAGHGSPVSTLAASTSSASPCPARTRPCWRSAVPICARCMSPPHASICRRSKPQTGRTRAVCLPARLTCRACLNLCWATERFFAERLPLKMLPVPTLFLRVGASPNPLKIAPESGASA